MALPLTGEAFEIQVEGELISKPYIDITLNLMRRFGVNVENGGYRRFRLPAARYHAPETVHVEGDASSASYFLAAGLLSAYRYVLPAWAETPYRAMPPLPANWKKSARR